MRTNIVIDDELMRDAMAAAGTSTMRDTVHEALTRMVQLHRQQEILKLRGKINWTGDLDEMRTSKYILSDR